MARPKNDSNQKQASERIEDAFWEALAKEPYSNITIANLARQAKVNHNTVYYYFDNIDDMAIKLFHRNMLSDMPQRMLSVFDSGDLDTEAFPADEQFIGRWRRARLFIRGESAFLTNLFKKTIMDAWLTAMNLDTEALSKEEKVELEFIFSGLTAVIGHPLVADDPKLIALILKRDLGHGITTTLSRLATAIKQST